MTHTKTLYLLMLNELPTRILSLTLSSSSKTVFLTPFEGNNSRSTCVPTCIILSEMKLAAYETTQTCYLTTYLLSS